MTDCCDRIDELEETLTNLKNEFRGYRDQIAQPKLNDLSEQSDVARSEREQLARKVEQLEAELSRMDARIESMIGLEEDQQSTPQKRVADLRQALIRRAQSRSDKINGKASMYYKEVQDLFADIGHGTVHRPEVMKAMRDATNTDGFEMGEKKSKHGNTVTAIRVNLDALPGGAACRDPTTSTTPSTPEIAANGPTETDIR